MKLYKIAGGIAFISCIIGIASICGAIECGTSLCWPIGILVFGCICAGISVKESGGYFDD